MVDDSGGPRSRDERLHVEQVVVRYGTLTAIAGVDLRAGAREIVALLGPSGCGKSTLLRAVAGLEPLAAGRVRWKGHDLAAVAPHARGFGLMFQEYVLFPHRDVAGNVEFGLRMAGAAATERAARVAEVLELVGLGGFERRRVASLSGGEQQRVALARVLAPRPRLLMLDEPLGALDRVLRERLVGELRELLGAAGAPALYVTHDHEEAFSVADRVAVMRAGTIVQRGAPDALWRRPADEWVAGFLGFGAGVDGTVAEGIVRTPWGVLPLPSPAGPVASPAPGPARVVLRPGALAPAGDGPVRGTVARRRFAGEQVALEVRVDAAPPLEVRVPPPGAPREGDPVTLAVDPDGVLVYPAQ